MATYGQRFRELRNEKDLTQEQLRQEFNTKYHYGFTLAAISQYENDKRIPEINALTDFADFFSVSIDYLLGRSDIKNITTQITTRAYHAVDTSGLNEEDIKKVEEYIELLKHRYNPDGSFKNKK